MDIRKLVMMTIRSGTGTGIFRVKEGWGRGSELSNRDRDLDEGWRLQQEIIEFMTNKILWLLTAAEVCICAITGQGARCKLMQSNVQLK